MIVDGADAAQVARAAQVLAAGGLCAFPTETVYGLGANAADDAAVRRIYEAKGRPSGHPLIVHLASAEQAPHFAASVPASAQRLMERLWPGPLTLVVPRRPGVAQAAAGGQGSIALRVPAHPMALALLRACASVTPSVPGLAAPSANRFGRVSPTTAAHVREELGDALLVLDGGPCEVGIESAVVDCTRDDLALLRPGMLGRNAIEEAAGARLAAPEDVAGPVPRAPGTLEAHYAPEAKVRLMDARSLQVALDVLGADAAHIAIYARSPLRVRSARVVQRRMPDDAQAAAQQLFAALRAFDAQGVRLIWVEAPPPDAPWDGVRDRLQRAAAA